MAIVPITDPTIISPEEYFHTWAIYVRTPGQQFDVAVANWLSIDITDSHEGVRNDVEIPADDPAVPLIRELVSDLLFYRDDILLYRLRVVDSEDVLSRDGATVKFSCVSYEKLLERRVLHEDWILKDQDIDAAWRLIDYTQKKQTFGITRGTTAPGNYRERAFDAGDDILTCINDLAQADGGFDWWIDQNLKFWAQKPRRGKNLNVEFQMGGQVGELSRLSPIEDYTSLVLATGAQQETRIPRDNGGEDVYPPPRPQIAQLTTKPYGLWEYTASDTDVITPGGLMEKAKWHLADKGAVRPSYKVILEPGVWTPRVAVGDTFTLRFTTTRANVKVLVRIEEMQITCSTDGAEAVAVSVRAEKPETPVSVEAGAESMVRFGELATRSDGAVVPLAGVVVPLADVDVPDPNGRTVQRNRLNPTDDLGALLRGLRKRLDRAERSPGTGVGAAGATILDGPYPPQPADGSPGFYWVDNRDLELYGPKSGGYAQWPPSVTSGTMDPATAVRTDTEVALLGVAQRPMSIVGFRFGGIATASETVTVSIWDRLGGHQSNTLRWKATASGRGTDWIAVQPPVHYDFQEQWAASVGGAAVPVHEPGGTYPPDTPSFVYLVGPEGYYTAPVGGPPASIVNPNESWQWHGSAKTTIEVLLQEDAPYVDADEDCASMGDNWPAYNITGEVGANLYVRERGHLVGWRYRKNAESSDTLTWNIWTSEYRYYDPAYANVKQFPTELIATIITTDAGEGEFEVRLPAPILMDPLAKTGPGAWNLMISFGGEQVPYGDEFNWGDRPVWYNAGFEFGYHNPTAGEFPQDNLPGSVYQHYKMPYFSPIMTKELPVWPLTNTAHSGSIFTVNPERVELRRNISASFSGDEQGLRFYEGGPSHDATAWGPGDGVPWFSASLMYDGNSGMEFTPDDWYDESGHTVWPAPATYTNKYAYYTWYYDFSYQEQDADLDDNHPTQPGSYYMTFGEQSVWDWYAYGDLNAYGPRFGANVNSEDYEGVTNGGAGLAYEVAELPDNTMAAIARMYVIGDDGVSGSSLNCTSKVIQACFPPSSNSDTWYTGRYSEGGMTPKGCVSPLVTAASVTATAADEPWQKQFFRQMGTTAVTFTAGVGTIGVPTAMALPAVVTAQVEGVAVGGNRVAQAQRTGNYVITIALDTAYDGTETIGWSVEHAVLTFGTPAPSIDAVRNPGSAFLYSNTVDYDAAGGDWAFEVVSFGSTLVSGCQMYDFTGALVGGPFTVEDVIDSGVLLYQRILWTVQRDWYLPGQEQQYRLQNPDDQHSNWTVVRWVDAVVFAATAERMSMQMRVDTARAAAQDPAVEPAVGPASGTSGPRTNYANNPVLAPQVQPVQATVRPSGVQARTADTAAEEPVTEDVQPPPARGERGKHKGGKVLRQAQRDRIAADRAARLAARDETTET